MDRMTGSETMSHCFAGRFDFFNAQFGRGSHRHVALSHHVEHQAHSPSDWRHAGCAASASIISPSSRMHVSLGALPHDPMADQPAHDGRTHSVIVDHSKTRTSSKTKPRPPWSCSIASSSRGPGTRSWRRTNRSRTIAIVGQTTAPGPGEPYSCVSSRAKPSKSGNALPSCTPNIRRSF